MHFDDYASWRLVGILKTPVQAVSFDWGHLLESHTETLLAGETFRTLSVNWYWIKDVNVAVSGLYIEYEWSLLAVLVIVFPSLPFSLSCTRMSFTSSCRPSGSLGESPVTQTVTSWSLPNKTQVSHPLPALCLLCLGHQLLQVYERTNPHSWATVSFSKPLSSQMWQIAPVMFLRSHSCFFFFFLVRCEAQFISAKSLYLSK